MFCDMEGLGLVARPDTFYHLQCAWSRAVGSKSGKLWNVADHDTCEYGPATYFITVTASPHCEELQAALLPGQEPSDHPDLVVRVFHRKLTLLLKHLKSVFGK